MQALSLAWRTNNLSIFSFSLSYSVLSSSSILLTITTITHPSLQVNIYSSLRSEPAASCSERVAHESPRGKIFGLCMAAESLTREKVSLSRRCFQPLITLANVNLQYSFITSVLKVDPALDRDTSHFQPWHLNSTV